MRFRTLALLVALTVPATVALAQQHDSTSHTHDNAPRTHDNSPRPTGQKNR
jgi:hypothetical protein